ncbi:hypothetical protein RFI_24196 [Reticulomyxa filosa]|uniref:Kelch motif family protein n=1 Tax=Reticulomyxa filosa TaxID=46433 RepID=X6MH06_RETFI|nr:hypothetical protein RFI_24196 [Reticulomyxa filosa]|eukprot:ETO13179.1 hypothetical protein RFI_24196 [Reticulomyxa filosa]
MDNQQKQASNTPTFETLASLPIAFSQSQCIVHKDEIIICGGTNKNECYSYHTSKDQYKYICSYPKEVSLCGHCVVKRVNKKMPHIINLLSFGGYTIENRHTLVMQYRSVWDDEEADKDMKQFNQWLPLVNAYNQSIILGTMRSNYDGARAVIGGSKNHLLFITHKPNDIVVIDLNTFRLIQQSKLLLNESWLYHHCFVAKDGLSNKQINKKKFEMLLFCHKTGLSIEYDENNNTLQFLVLWVCTTIRPLKSYAYVAVDNIVFFLVDMMTPLLHLPISCIHIQLKKMNG